jgi:ATP phosphoribosyltransferase regulatory subunit
MQISKDKFRSWIPHGFNFLSVKETEIITDLSNKIRKDLKREGCNEIIPPTFDFYQTFQLTTRQVLNQVFEIHDASGEILAVRSDLTVQVIKAAASGRLGRVLPLNLFYIQPVFQDRTWGAGNRREILQAGVEIIGDSSENRFQRLLTLSSNLLRNNNFTPKFLYGDMQFLNILFQNIQENLKSELAEAFHQKDTSLIRSLAKEAGLPPEIAHLLVEVPLVFGDTTALDELTVLCKKNDKLLYCIEQARKISGVVYDFSLVRELSYYTGPVFEGYITSSKEAVITGGVYDSLFEQFSGEKNAACGFAINLSVISEYI